jgi:CheY-specific phosphatase CheX
MNIDARQVIKAVTDMSSDNARAKIKALMGAEADALLKQIDEAAQSAVVRAAVATNSKTAVRGSIRQGVEEITAPGVVGQAMAGEPINATKALIQSITGQTAEYTATQKQRIFEDIARALTEKKGQTAQAALVYLQQAMRGQPLTAAQNEFLARQIAATTVMAGIPAAQEVTGR